MKNIYDYSLEQLTEYFQSIKQKPFRAKQVFSWLYQKDARSFDDMSDLSKELRNSLKDEFNFDILKIKEKQVKVTSQKTQTTTTPVKTQSKKNRYLEMGRLSTYLNY